VTSGVRGATLSRVFTAYQIACAASQPDSEALERDCGVQATNQVRQSNPVEEKREPFRDLR
jgi:hypothetical protein